MDSHLAQVNGILIHHGADVDFCSFCGNKPSETPESSIKWYRVKIPEISSPYVHIRSCYRAACLLKFVNVTQQPHFTPVQKDNNNQKKPPITSIVVILFGFMMLVNPVYMLLFIAQVFKLFSRTLIPFCGAVVGMVIGGGS